MLRRLGILCKWLLLALIVALVVLFAVNNSAYTTVTLFPLPYEADIPLFLLAMLAFSIGLLTGGLMMGFRTLRVWRLFRRAHRRSDALDQELRAIRHDAPAARLPAGPTRAA